MLQLSAPDGSFGPSQCAQRWSQAHRRLARRRRGRMSSRLWSFSTLALVAFLCSLGLGRHWATARWAEGGSTGGGEKSSPLSRAAASVSAPSTVPIVNAPTQNLSTRTRARLSATSASSSEDALSSPELPATHSRAGKIVPTLGASGAPRLLYTIASLARYQVKYFENILDSIRDYCEAGFDPHVIVDTGEPFSATHEQVLRNRLFCFRTNASIPLEIHSYNRRIGDMLTVKHREHMKRLRDEFDVFVYGEDDMLISVSNLQAYLRETERMRQASRKVFENYIVAFMRFENSVNCVTDQNVGTIGPTNHRMTWEYPTTHTVSLPEGLGKYVMLPSPHQAAYIVTREQLDMLDKRCNFLSTSKRPRGFHGTVKVWVSSFQFVQACKLKRVVPMAHYQSFLIHHQPDKNHLRRDKQRYRSVQHLYKAWVGPTPMSRR